LLSAIETNRPHSARELACFRLISHRRKALFLHNADDETYPDLKTGAFSSIKPL
jgi:hypothetical protein